MYSYGQTGLIDNHNPTSLANFNLHRSNASKLVVRYYLLHYVSFVVRRSQLNHHHTTCLTCIPLVTPAVVSTGRHDFVSLPSPLSFLRRLRLSRYLYLPSPEPPTKLQPYLLTLRFLLFCRLFQWRRILGIYGMSEFLSLSLKLSKSVQ